MFEQQNDVTDVFKAAGRYVMNYHNEQFFNFHTGYDVDNILNNHITQEEIKSSVKDLCRVMPQQDGIKAEMIQICSTILIPHLSVMYNNMCSTGNFPYEWLKLLFYHYTKKGSFDYVNND